MNKKIPTIQIINKKIDVAKLSTRYYNKKRAEIKRNINHKSDVVIVNLIPNNDIEEKWVVELLLHLQREFTDVVIIPKTTIDDDDLSEWINFFNPSQVLKTEI